MNRLLKTQFRPEFLNRLDEIVFYKPLTQTETKKIVGLLLKGLKSRLEEKELHLEVSDEAIEQIVSAGYDPVFGARPLKRFIQTNVETLIAKKIVSGVLNPNDTLLLQFKDGAFTVKVK